MQAGKRLEQLVRTIEGYLLPLGFKISSNVRVVEQKQQLAEFDIVIEGQTELRQFRWLIECRDRPSNGPAPGQWIEQLVGRQRRFRFDKVTAVSTTGFAEAVKPFALEEGIELRTINELNAQDIIGWFLSGTTTIQHIGGKLDAVKVFPLASETSESIAALNSVVGQTKLDKPVLRSVESGENISAINAFGSAVYSNIDKLRLAPNEEPQPVRLCVKFDGAPQYTITTDCGDVSIALILFEGFVTYWVEHVPIRDILQYQSDSGEQKISQSVSFKLPLTQGPIDLEFHRLMDTGETRILLRKDLRRDTEVVS
jgi:hypothetical protein